MWPRACIGIQHPSVGPFLKNSCRDFWRWQEGQRIQTKPGSPQQQNHGEASMKSSWMLPQQDTQLTKLQDDNITRPWHQFWLQCQEQTKKAQEKPTHASSWFITMQRLVRVRAKNTRASSALSQSTRLQASPSPMFLLHNEFLKFSKLKLF